MAKDMTQKEFVTAYGKRWERLSADEFVHSDYSAQCLADLHSVIRGETSELLKQRDDAIDKVETLVGYLKTWQSGKTPLELDAVIKEANEWIEITKAEER